MIIYLFNQYFGDNSGFGRRCKREVYALSELDDITVICRRNKNEVGEELVESNAHSIHIIRYQAASEVVHRPVDYKANGVYEAKRNLEIMFELFKTLFKVARKNKNKEIKIFCVNSPLTVPFVCVPVALIFRAKLEILEFHDLEPELAIHLKNLSFSHWLVKAELILEWLACRLFKKIVVTTQGQANLLSSRTEQGLDKFCVIENGSNLIQKNDELTSLNLPLSKHDFVISYLSTISFDYTVLGLIESLKLLKSAKQQIPNLKVIIIGDGEGKPFLDTFISDEKISNWVFCTGQLSNPASAIKMSSVAIIPWNKDIMTETMLPTKLFEYLSLKIPVLAPDFGEFSRTLTDKKNALLYRDNAEFIDDIIFLSKNKEKAVQIGESGFSLYSSEFNESVLNQKLLNFFKKQ